VSVNFYNRTAATANGREARDPAETSAGFASRTRIRARNSPLLKTPKETILAS
jgi:hypothetical protein